jgi:hypothetical protein
MLNRSVKDFTLSTFSAAITSTAQTQKPHFGKLASPGKFKNSPKSADH